MIDDHKKRNLIEIMARAYCQEMKQWLEDNSHYVIIGDKEIPVYIFLPVNPTDNRVLPTIKPEVIYDDTEEEDVSENPEVEELWEEYEGKYSPIKRLAHITLDGSPRTVCTTHDITDEEWELIQLALIKLYKDNESEKINTDSVLDLCH